MDPILRDLNAAQRAAVTHGEGPLMVIAGAGSGKTRVITRRIAWLLHEGELPESILAVTFTNKAAEEMARRVQELGGRRVHISTFHSAGARFLRANGHHLGYPRNFSIFDTYDRDSCLKLLMQEQGLDLESVKPAHVGNLISRLKNLGVTPEEYRESHGTESPFTVEEVTAELFGKYQERLLRLGALDFDDLLTRLLDLLRTVPEVAQGYQERFKWILVDEFQDTNRVQYELTRQLAGPRRNLCVVGDPDQSIYRFRGAELRNILDFQRDYPDVHVVRLEANYRSTRRILRAAQGVIENNTERLPRDLTTDGEEGEPLVYEVHPDALEETRRVCRRIIELLQQRVSPSEIAVFYRSHYLSRGLEDSLRRMGVPYEVVGGLSFFERREIKDLIAYLRVAMNPLDDVSLERIINVPPRRIGKAALAKLREIASAQQMSLFEVVREPELHGGLPAAARRALADLSLVFEQVQERADEASGALRALLDGTGYIAYACALGDPQDVAREENIGELVSDAADFDRRFGGGLPAYLSHVSLLTSEDRRADPGPRVSLMTIHSAKGLEFDHVFLIGLEEGVLPSSRADTATDIEEERRLMYVALTRARRTVYLSSCQRRMLQGLELDQIPSRFVNEIPDDCLAARPKPRRDAWTHWERDEHAEDPRIAGADAALDEELLAALRPNAHVLHRVYGEGVVQRVSGRGSFTRAVVRFADGRERTLLLDYGELQVVPGSDEW